MRLNKLLMVALAGMTMLSCSNNDEPDGNPSNENKKVVLRLEGIKSAKTRSTDAPTENKHTINVNKVAVVFYDNTAKKVMMVDEVTASDEADSDWGKLTGMDGKSYSNVPASVSHVMVVGNASEQLAEEIHKGQDVEAIKNYTHSLAKENQPAADAQDTKSNVTLYGNAEITAVSDEDDTYEAKVNINPLVSRFEIKSVGCKFPDANSAYQKLVLKGIGLVDYYSQATIASQATDDGTITTKASVQKVPVDGTNSAVENGIFDPTSTAVITGDGSYKFCDANAEDWAWSFDVLPSDVEINGTGEQIFKENEQKNYTFAYNFFPQDGADELYHTPNICAWVEAYTNGTDKDDDHTVVTSTMMKGGQPLVPKAGEIYQLDYIFEEGDIDEWIPTITVKVNVTVAQWNIVPVTPEF